MVELTTGFQAAEYTGPEVVMCNCLGPATNETLCPCALNRLRADEVAWKAKQSKEIAPTKP